MSSLSARTKAPWRVGVLFAQSGCTCGIEQTQLRGTLLAIEEINGSGGVNGREIEPVIYDPGNGTIPCAYLAKKLLIEDGVTSIFGCYTSISRKVVMPIIERLNGLLWYSTPYEGFEYSPNVIYTGATPNQNSLRLCRFLFETYGSRFYLIGSDYVYPRRSNSILRELVAAQGGTVVAEHYVDIRARREDFLPIMRDIRDSSVDVVFSTVVGESTSHLYQAYAEAGFDPKRMPIASLTTTEEELRAMGFNYGEAHITAASYFECVETKANRAFVSRYKKRFGESQSTNVCAETAYFQVHMFARTLAQTNSMATDDLRPLVLGSSFDAPQGSVRIAPSGHADLWTRIGRATRDGQFDVVWESPGVVQSDPFLLCSSVRP
jgi:ABC-type branched-subunit amino acid transport system substrate-binding protein